MIDETIPIIMLLLSPGAASGPLNPGGIIAPIPAPTATGACMGTEVMLVGDDGVGFDKITASIRIMPSLYT